MEVDGIRAEQIATEAGVTAMGILVVAVTMNHVMAGARSNAIVAIDVMVDATMWYAEKTDATERRGQDAYNNIGGKKQRNPRMHRISKLLYRKKLQEISVCI